VPGASPPVRPCPRSAPSRRNEPQGEEPVAPGARSHNFTDLASTTVSPRQRVQGPATCTTQNCRLCHAQKRRTARCITELL
jgi:hypothetical protein